MELTTLNKNFLAQNVGTFVGILADSPLEYWREEHFLSELPDKWNYSAVAVENGQILGYVIASSKTEAIHIHKFMVSSDQRGRGIGTRLLAFFESLCRRDHHKKVTLKVHRENDGAIRFYKNVGFMHCDDSGDYRCFEKTLRLVLSVHQPNFIPWLGYFYKIASSDIFIIFDDVQMPRGKSVASRNKIKTPTGALDLVVPITIPSGFEGKVSYRQVQFGARDWQLKVLKTIRLNYSRTPYFTRYFPVLEDIFATENFCAMNIRFIDFVVREMGFKTKIELLSEVDAGDKLGRKNDLILNLCTEKGARVYLSGTGARKYNDEGLYRERGIELVYQQFDHPRYPQLYGDFIPNLSVIDLLFNCGEASGKVLLSGAAPPSP